jgi:hypothetical protein
VTEGVQQDGIFTLVGMGYTQISKRQGEWVYQVTCNIFGEHVSNGKEETRVVDRMIATGFLDLRTSTLDEIDLFKQHCPVLRRH